MKIDFHCHTKAIKSGEKVTRNINASDFKKTINSANVKMVAITNHNYFNKEEFSDFKKEINGDFILLPGIELDVIGIDSDKGHVVLIYDDTDLDNFANKIQELLNDTHPNDFKIDADKLITFINDVNCIVMAHYYKPAALSEKTINKIRDNINDSFRFFYEPSDYRTLGIMINHNYRALKGTDLKDWNDYQKQDFATIKLDIDSYKQLMFFLKKDISVIETLLNRRETHNINIAYLKDEIEPVVFYDDINVFFGTKGTGKTESINKIKTHFYNKGKNISYYSPNNSQDKLDEKLKVSLEEKKLATYGRDNCESELETISKWSETNVTQFVDYYNYVKYKDSNENKKKMKIVDIKSMMGYNAKALIEIKDEHSNALNIIGNISKIKLDKYLNKEEITQLNNILLKLNLGINKDYCLCFDEKSAVNLTNFSVSSIKKTVEKKTETKTIPSETGFTSYSKNLFCLENNMNKIISNFDFKTETDVEFVGMLEENKRLDKKTIITMLNKDSLQADGFTNIMALKSLKSTLIEISENIYSKKLGGAIAFFKTEYDKYTDEENKIKLNLDIFVGVVKRFILNDLFYKPSTGEATMIILDEALSKDSDVYILDEPEKSLGNNYISEVLVGKLNDLAKRKKVVIVVTHNANIAVRTLPYRSILKTYDNGVYKTYIGNPYTNQLINIKDDTDCKNWKDESIKILEGGKDAFDERSDIYA